MAEDAAPEAVHLKDYRPPAHLIDTADLLFALDPRATRVRARLAVRPNPAAEPADRLVLDGERLKLLRVALDGRDLAPDAYAVDDERLTVTPPAGPFVLETEVEIDPAANTALEGLYLSNGVFCTQCEAEGFRRITYFPDRPDVMAVYTVRVEADRAACPVLLANGNPGEAGELPGGRHFAVWRDPHPKPSYLFALVAGDLGHVKDGFTTSSGRDVELRVYTEHDKLDQCGHAMESLKKAMRWDEEAFGLEYDLDVFTIVAVSDFNFGAMENKGLNIFNTKYVLAKPDTATDGDHLGIEGVVAHEYFHNWTGDRVTCRDWFQLTLKEGLTVFRDQEFTSDVNSRPVKRIADVRGLRAGQFPQDSGPLAHPIRPESYIEINNFYTATVYEKGAEVIRMIHTLIGAEAFRRGMDLYFERHDNSAVTCEDFVRAMEDASGRDLTRFRRWYSQAGTPRVEARGAHDPDSATFRLTLRQSCPPTPGQPEKRPFHLPIRMGLLAPDGTGLPLRLEGENESRGAERVLELTEPEQTFTFVDVPAPPVPSLLRGFSAPVILESGHDEEDLRFLMAHDPDGFGRWEAGQSLALRLMLRLVDDRRAGRELRADAGFTAAIAAVLDDDGIDPALKAQALTLPSETYLGEQMATIDVDAVHAVHRFVRTALARELRAGWRRVFDAARDDGPYRFDAASAGRRSLKNLCLATLAADDDPEGLRLAVEQNAAAANMTDVVAALAVLAESGSPERGAAFDAFYERWKADALVVDKWFALQATARRPDALEIVERLARHPAFTLANPNRARSLVGAFAAGNPTGFHRADGKGYAFVSAKVRELDRLNPQVAARLVQSFGRWRRYDARRQGLMRAELRAVRETPGLSRDVREIVGKSLEG